MEPILPNSQTSIPEPCSVAGTGYQSATKGAESLSGTLTMVETADGHLLAIEHFHSAPSAVITPPIVLCPGFGGNRFNFDLDESHSLARHLATAGFDVWIVELRGQGRSKNQTRSRDTAGSIGWTIDDHVEEDLPALLKAITKLSARRKVIWIGHSLGGMVAYCLLARRPEYEQFFAGLITLGAPAHVVRPWYWRFLVSIEFFFYLLGAKRTVSVRLPLKIVYSLIETWPGSTRLFRYWANPKNIESSVVMRTISVGLEPLSIAILQQWVRSMRHNSLLSFDGSFDYFSNLDRITIPILFISGTVDRVASAKTILAAYDRVQAHDKRIRVFGRQGFEIGPTLSRRVCKDSVDYGHEDLLVGEANHTEVFSYVVSWLRVHPSGSQHS